MIDKSHKESNTEGKRKKGENDGQKIETGKERKMIKIEDVLHNDKVKKYIKLMQMLYLRREKHHSCQENTCIMIILNNEKII